MEASGANGVNDMDGVNMVSGRCIDGLMDGSDDVGD